MPVHLLCRSKRGSVKILQVKGIQNGGTVENPIPGLMSIYSTVGMYYTD